MEEVKETYSVTELCNKFEISRNTLFKHINEGTIPGMFRIGNLFRFKRCEVDTWINNGGHQENIKERRYR